MTALEILLTVLAIYAATQMGDVLRFDEFARALNRRRPRGHEFE